MVIRDPGCMVDATGELICPGHEPGDGSGRQKPKPEPPGPGVPRPRRPVYHIEDTPPGVMTEEEARRRGYWVDYNDEPVDHFSYTPPGIMSEDEARQRGYWVDYQPESGTVTPSPSFGAGDAESTDSGLMAWSRAEDYYSQSSIDVGLLAETRRLNYGNLQVSSASSQSSGSSLWSRLKDALDMPVKGWEMIAHDAKNWLEDHPKAKALFFSPAYFLGDLAYKASKGEDLSQAVHESFEDSVEFGESAILSIPVGIASIVSPTAWESMFKKETYTSMWKTITSGSPSARGELVGTLIGAAVGGKALGVIGKTVRFRDVDIAPSRPSTLRAPIETSPEAIRRAFYEPETADLFDAYTRGTLSKERLLDALEEASKREKPEGPTTVYHATSANIPSKFTVLEGSSPTPGLYVGPKAYPAFAVGAVMKMGFLDRLRLLGADFGKPQFLKLEVEDVVLPEKGLGKAPANAPWRGRIVQGVTDTEGFLEYQAFVRSNAGKPIAIVSPEVTAKLPWRGELEVEAVIPPETGFKEALMSRLLHYETEITAPEVKARIKDVVEFSSREEAEAFAKQSKDIVVLKGKKAYVLESEWTGRYRRVPVRVREIRPASVDKSAPVIDLDVYGGRRGGFIVDSMIERSLTLSRELVTSLRYPGQGYWRPSPPRTRPGNGIELPHGRGGSVLPSPDYTTFGEQVDTSPRSRPATSSPSSNRGSSGYLPRSSGGAGGSDNSRKSSSKSGGSSNTDSSNTSGGNGGGRRRKPRNRVNSTPPRGRSSVKGRKKKRKLATDKKLRRITRKRRKSRTNYNEILYPAAANPLSIRVKL